MTHIVLNVVKMLNYFPIKGGISNTLIPKKIMSSETLDYKKKLFLNIGQYCRVHEEYSPHNSQTTRTRGAICLGTSEKLQGRFKLLALNFAKKTIRRSWDAILMPDTVIARINMLSGDQPGLLTFTYWNCRLIRDVQIPGVPPETPTTLEPDNIDIEIPVVEL